MNTTAPLPASLRRSELTARDLDARIEQAEQRLIAREENLQRRVSALLGRTRSALAPRRLLAPVLAVAAGIGALWWTFRGGRARAAVSAVRGPAGPAARGEVPWVRLAGLAWPLLPQRWRMRIPPGLATAFVSIGLPLLERLLARRQLPPLDTVAALDIAAFAGRWHELAQLPQPLQPVCAEPPQRHYAPQADGSLLVLRRCVDQHGREHEWHHRAEPVPGSQGAQWRLGQRREGLRWLPGGWQDHWVLLHEPQAGIALVGSPDRARLVLLARRPRLEPDERQRLLQTARDRGFDLQHLRFEEW